MISKFRGSLLLAGSVAALIAACDAPRVTDTASIDPSSAAVNLSKGGNGNSSVQKDLATLRQVTAKFHRFEAAKDAQWSAKITSCMSDPTLGGMGFHYGNIGLIDGSVRVDEPELLLYEPEKNGRLRLVAVEYIIPYTFHSRDAEAPELFGQKFQPNDAFKLWGLHAWVWKDNPSGMFANWNPTVSCKFTTDVMAMAMAH
jgi:hypothetical protein